MNWLLIILLSVFGGIMGLLSIKGYTQKIEPFLWILFAIATALVLSRNVENRAFVHAVIIGFCWGLLNGLIQSSFFDQYLANSPSLKDSFEKSASVIKPRYFVLITGPLIGLVIGAVMGGLTLLFRTFWHR